MVFGGVVCATDRRFRVRRQADAPVPARPAGAAPATPAAAVAESRA